MSIIIKQKEKLEVNDILKCIGILTMLCDHIGAIMYPHNLVYRLVGRLAFPIYAYYICIGYTNTNNIKNYWMRMFVLAVISQPIYSLQFKGLNTICTLLMGIIAINFLNRKNIIGVIIIILITQFANMDYGAYGIITILAIYKNITNNMYCFITYIIFTILFNPLQIFAVIFFVFIKIKWKFSFKLPKYITYAFYPLHIFILHVILKTI